MPKPRGRGTSAEPRRTVKASSGRARAQPRVKAGERGGAAAGSPVALRDRQERQPASSRARPRKAKAAAALAERAATKRPAAPGKRATAERPATPGKRAAAERPAAPGKRATAERPATPGKRAAAERPARPGKRAAAERPARPGKRAATDRPAAPRGRAARARADEQARVAPPKRRRRRAKAESEAELAPPRPPELDWDDTPSGSAEEALARRWAARGEALFEQLAAHGASAHEYRADLKDGRFVWIAPGGRVSAEARARLLCSWSRATSVLLMAWADPLVSGAGIERVDGMPAEQDSVDEAGAWQIAMAAAEACGAAYLYRVSSPQAWYFLALDELTFVPKRASFHPGAPVGLVLRAIAEVREAIASRAEPADVVRDRISALSDSLFHQAMYAYRDTDWVARLERTGTCLMHLARRIPRASYSAIAAGQRIDEWLERELAVELINALSLIEDEWSLFG
ncbi:DUF6882 domain-containing protein [Sorangium sp. So ce291]|uniref:DUF6882 domain-containing protein n=1 Tax=Sorangium sp. So ce291 TaxID=3133294 RepID=UPI003F62FD16